jgi:hypothetical protein
LATLLKFGEVLVKHRRPRPRHPEVASEATDREHRKENPEDNHFKERHCRHPRKSKGPAETAEPSWRFERGEGEEDGDRRTMREEYKFR